MVNTETVAVKITEEAYKVIIAHAHATGETIEQAVDELVYAGAGHTWSQDMPEMKRTYPQFMKYYRQRYD